MEDFFNKGMLRKGDEGKIFRERRFRGSDSDNK